MHLKNTCFYFKINFLKAESTKNRHATVELPTKNKIASECGIVNEEKIASDSPKFLHLVKVLVEKQKNMPEYS